ncbi:GATA zinc finger domain-containing protein 10-like isoform X1 [Pecten maximus]|uniref:GATA zinc finger domain-containing protein 10-like isoform X1 n=1 Tax=Pecten maximus TaxID=6579 RepID=UPI001458D39A|nr:GATA zinc finger domain-containing protein 10-like isoform X1 [Pecten maximus]
MKTTFSLCDSRYSSIRNRSGSRICNWLKLNRGDSPNSRGDNPNNRGDNPNNRGDNPNNRGLLQQNQAVVQQPQLNQVAGQQVQQSLQFQPVQGLQPKQSQGFVMGNVNNPLVGDNQHLGGDNLPAQHNQGVQEMQQQNIEGDKKISDNLMEQQQQQHQVQAPNLNAGAGDKNQYGQLKKIGVDTSRIKIKQDVNDNAALDAEQQQHQVAPPGDHVKIEKPDSNMAGEMDKNPFGDKNGQNKKHDSNQAGEMEPDPKGDNHVGPAPPANDNVDPPIVADNPQQNIPPPRENDPFVGQDNEGLDHWNGVNPLVDDRFQDNADEDEKKALDEEDGKDEDNKDEDYEDDYNDKGEDKEDEPANREDNAPDPFANKPQMPFGNNQ